MDKLTLPKRTVPIIADADVLVAGAGVGGFAAALAAARNGAATTLVERLAYPGGVATASLMCSITNLLVTQSGETVVGGIAAEFLDRLVDAGASMPDYARPGQPQIPNDPEIVKRVMLTMLREAGVKCLYGAMITQAVMDEERVDGLVLESKGGAAAVTMRQIVDATGDLDIFALTDAETGLQNPTGASLLFRMANVDIDRIIDWYEEHPENYNHQEDIPTSLADTISNWRDYGVFHLPHGGGRNCALVKEALASGRLPETFGDRIKSLALLGMFASRTNRSNVLINSNMLPGDATNLMDRTELEQQGRLACYFLADYLIECFPGFGNAYLLDTAAEMGVRVSRWLKGRYTLTAHEHSEGVAFDDSVGMITFVDHSIKPFRRYLKGGQIPFGCLVANRPVNVVVGSGKSASTQPEGLLRGQVGCLVVGEAAGTAAALACDEQASVNAVDVKRLRTVLGSQGVIL